MKIQYVTSNTNKFKEAALILQPAPSAAWSLVHTSFPLTEIQGSLHEIALHKVQEAYATLHSPVIIDDVSVSFHALGNLPGPYIRHFLEALGVDGLWQLLSHYDDRRCSATCTIALLERKDSKPHIFDGRMSGIIVPPRGTISHSKESWNAIFQPDGFSQTFAELTIDEISKISPRNRALVKAQKYLNETYTR